MSGVVIDNDNGSCSVNGIANLSRIQRDPGKTNEKTRTSRRVDTHRYLTRKKKGKKRS